MALAQRAHLVPDRVGLSARLPLRQSPLAASGDDVSLFTGCVMDAWQRDVHQAGQRVLEAAGIGVSPTGDPAPCCGALQLHAGLTAETRKLAHQVIRSIPADRPVLVDSAGCGAAMKDYGRLLGTSAARAFRRAGLRHPGVARAASRTPARCQTARHPRRDPGPVPSAPRPASARGDADRAPSVRPRDRRVGRRRAVLRRRRRVRQLEPVLAADIRARKLASIDRAKPDVVVSANPGCAMHLAAGRRADRPSHGTRVAGAVTCSRGRSGVGAHELEHCCRVRTIGAQRRLRWVQASRRDQAELDPIARERWSTERSPERSSTPARPARGARTPPDRAARARRAVNA